MACYCSRRVTNWALGCMVPSLWDVWFLPFPASFCKKKLWGLRLQNLPHVLKLDVAKQWLVSSWKPLLQHILHYCSQILMELRGMSQDWGEFSHPRLLEGLPDFTHCCFQDHQLHNVGWCGNSKAVWLVVRIILLLWCFTFIHSPVFQSSAFYNWFRSR